MKHLAQAERHLALAKELMNKGKQNGLPLKVSCGVLVAMLDRGTGWLTEQDRAA